MCEDALCAFPILDKFIMPSITRSAHSIAIASDALIQMKNGVTKMSWFHEDPEYTLKIQMEHGEENRVTDIIGLGPSLAHQLECVYNITTIAELLDYVIINGFPGDVDFREETKFVLSAKCAKKFMKDF